MTSPWCRRPERLAVLAALWACASPPAEVSDCDPPRGPAVGWFEARGAASGLDFWYDAPNDFKGGGLAVADLAGDALPDVVAARRDGGLALFENLGALRFRDVTAEVGLDPSAAASALASADLDADGDHELVVAGDGVTRIFAREEGGRFTELEPLLTGGPTEHVLPVDLDGDGLLDLYLSNYDVFTPERSENRLYMNQGGLSLREAPANGPGASFTTSAIDFDGDGDQDLYVANDTLIEDYDGPDPEDPDPPSGLPVDRLLRNDGLDGEGNPILTDVAAVMGLDTPRSSMGGLVADFDGDELLDLYVTDFGANKLFLGRKGGPFVETAAQVGLAAPRRFHSICPADSPLGGCLFVHWGAVMADFDLDGRDEVLVANGEVRTADPPPVLLFTQTEEGRWVELDPGVPCVDGRGVVAADLDDDGDPDLLVGPRIGPLAMYENRAPRRGRWLRVVLSGEVNRHGVGARVVARFADGRTRIRMVGAGGVVHSSGPPEAHFGLGSPQPEALEIEVEWPSGRRMTLPDPPQDGILVVGEMLGI